MTRIFIFLFLAQFYKSIAASSFVNLPANYVAFLAQDESRPVWDIFWCCLATTIVLPWVCVHPNVPWLEKSWPILKRRIFLMLVAVFVPQIMIMWAFKQWRGAVAIRDAMNEARPKTSMQWTMVHAHFLLMGGFKVNYIKGELPHSLDAYEVEKNGIVVQECVLCFATLQSLLEKQLINNPDTTAKEIIDRSNGSIGTTTLKAFAMMQITWFFVQLFARALQHLTITLLEFTTATSVVLIVIMYIIWWSKPFDVRQPIVLRTKEVELKLAQMAVGPNEEKWKF